MRKITTINIQSALLDKIEDLLDEAQSKSRSEFIRKALEWWYAEYEWESLAGPDRIITCNFDYEDLKLVNNLVETGVFTSRSELFRVAILQYIQKLERQKENREQEETQKPKVIVQKLQDEEIISIPVCNSAEIYKTYKIIPKEKINEKIRDNPQEVSNMEV